ncbi:tetratricopeptide repeat protein, partial [Chryseobacterium sp.]|uniref:tetratricopeptide repeat protein n=1 Tax=Chryseobacterium sp. TaxID=1871047 RepID=UPI00289AC583
NKFDVGIFLLKKIIQKFPSRVVAYLNLADNYWAINDKDLAKKNYKKYIELMKSQNKDQSKIPQRVFERIK